MSERAQILLFDLDGTLISAGGAGRSAMQGAIDEMFGRDDLLDFDFSGRTDRAIARAALHKAGVDADEIEAAIGRFLDRYVEVLAAALDPPPERYRVLPGVLALLDALESAGGAGVALGLCTGNIEAGARIKLSPAGLANRFAFGGFGSDAEDRAALLEIGARRGAARLGVPRERCRVVIIGDTPLDIAAAHAIGAECLAVSTGNFAAETLRDAERVVETLDASLWQWLLDR